AGEVWGAGTAGNRVASGGKASAAPAWRLPIGRLPGLLIPCDRFGLEIAGKAAARHQARIGGTELGLDGLERNVGERAAVGEIFHVAAAGAIEGMEQRVGLAVEVEGLQSDLFAQGLVEGGRCLHPAAVEMKVGIGGPDD